MVNYSEFYLHTYSSIEDFYIYYIYFIFYIYYILYLLKHKLVWAGLKAARKILFIYIVYGAKFVKCTRLKTFCLRFP